MQGRSHSVGCQSPIWARGGLRSWFAEPRKSNRHGISTLALVLAFGLVVSCIALAVDLGLLVQRHQQLKTAGEAASLAGALNLFNSLPVTIEHEPQIAEARRFALAYAAENSFNEFRLALDANMANRPRGDIVVGTVDPLVIGSPFIPAEKDTEQHTYEKLPRPQPSPLNAVLVRTRHSQAGGSGPILFFGSMVGVPSHDVYTESIAAVERRIVGYRPVNCAPVPMLPLLCITARWEPGDLQLSDDHDAQQSERKRHKELDRFTFDPVSREVSAGEDGVPEIEITLKIDEKNGPGEQNDQAHDNKSPEGNNPGKPNREFKLGQKVEAEIVQFSGTEDAGAESTANTTHVASDALTSQILWGLTAADLLPVGGQVVLGSQLACLQGNSKKQTSANVDGKELHTALEQIVGQPRLLLLGSKQPGKGRQTAVVEDFAAGVIVNSSLRDGAVIIRVQPMVLNSCTAITEGELKSNPWIGKVVLVR